MTKINLTDLPAPEVIEVFSYEELFASKSKKFRELMPEYEGLAFKSDPVVKLLELMTYEEMILRTRINTAAKSLLLAFSNGNDLAHLSADFNIERQIIKKGDPNATPPIEAVFEDDNMFRLRRQLAPEGLTTAGSDGSYLFHTISAGAAPKTFKVESPEAGKLVVTYEYKKPGFGAKVKHSSVDSPEPGQILVTILAHENNGIADQKLIDAVTKHLKDDDIRPLSESVSVIAGDNLNFSIKAKIYIYEGPSAQLVKTKAYEDLQNFVTSRHMLGEIVTSSGIDAALSVAGVQKVEIINWTDVITNKSQAPFCTDIDISYEVVSDA